MRNEKHRSLVVYSIELLYHIADAGYLEQLNEVRPDRLNHGKRIYYFDHIPELEKIIKDYQAERQNEKGGSSKLYQPFCFTEEDRKAIIDGVVAQLKAEKEEDKENDQTD